MNFAIGIWTIFWVSGLEGYLGKKNNIKKKRKGRGRGKGREGKIKGKKKKKEAIPSNLLKFIRVLVITRPSAAALGAMETGIAANKGGYFQLIPISEKKKKIGFCGMIHLKDFAPIF